MIKKENIQKLNGIDKETNKFLNLKTDKEKIIKYLKFKENLTFEQTGIRSFISADFDEVENWREEDCCKIWEKLTNFSQEYPSWDCGVSLHLPQGDFGFTCPWCISKNCQECGYGERHGHCSGDDSLWRDIFVKILDETDFIQKCQKIIIEINKEEEFIIKLKELPINILKELICIKEKKI